MISKLSNGAVLLAVLYKPGAANPLEYGQRIELQQSNSGINSLHFYTKHWVSQCASASAHPQDIITPQQLATWLATTWSDELIGQKQITWLILRVLFQRFKILDKNRAYFDFDFCNDLIVEMNFNYYDMTHLMIC